LGDLKEPTSKKLLIDLISTLDEFFPDYDFETTKYVARTRLDTYYTPFSQDLFAPFSFTPAIPRPEQFLIMEVNQVIPRVNEALAELTQERPTILENLWRSIDNVVSLRHCDVFSLVPDMAEDPFSDGTLWSFNYFFFNYDLKQLVYFTCVAKSRFRRDEQMDVTLDEDDEDEDDEDDDDSDAEDRRRGLFVMDDSADADSLDGGEAPDFNGII